MLKLRISKKAEKFLKEILPKHQKQIALKILELQKNGHGQDSKKLKASVFFRSDIGEYRIIYQIENDEILVVLLIGKRNDNDVYKKINRL
jgi:mRNA interferase RelE/StbE